jgi:hypothetical protein
MNRRITRARALIGAAALLCVLVVPLTATGSVGGSGDTKATASGVKKQIKKLKRKVKKLQQQVQGEQGSPRPPAGPAGGDLAGTYPDPAIATGAVNSAKVANGSLRGADIDRGTSISLSTAHPITTTLNGEGLSMRGGIMSHATAEVDIGDVTVSSCDSSDTCGITRLDSASFSPGVSTYGSTITLPEVLSSSLNPPANSARIYVRDSGGLTQLVARFADGEIDVLAEEAP